MKMVLLCFYAIIAFVSNAKALECYTETVYYRNGVGKSVPLDGRRQSNCPGKKPYCVKTSGSFKSRGVEC